MSIEADLPAAWTGSDMIGWEDLVRFSRDDAFMQGLLNTAELWQLNREQTLILIVCNYRQWCISLRKERERLQAEVERLQERIDSIEAEWAWPPD